MEIEGGIGRKGLLECELTAAMKEEKITEKIKFGTEEQIGNCG